MSDCLILHERNTYTDGHKNTGGGAQKYWMPDDSVYLPIQVGAALHPALGYVPDNTGYNISDKNPNYCELTALYWAWKTWNVNTSAFVTIVGTSAIRFIQRM